MSFFILLFIYIFDNNDVILTMVDQIGLKKSELRAVIVNWWWKNRKVLYLVALDFLITVCTEILLMSSLTLNKAYQRKYVDLV